MARKLARGRIVIASHNPGKVPEINALVAPFGLNAVSAADLGLAVPDETETTFAGNASLKARAAAIATGMPALADDSGLEVAALGGAPGVYSADWAEDGQGGPRDFARAMARVQRTLIATGTDDFKARFVCCLCIAWPDGHAEAFVGQVAGALVFPPRGDQGFGYDPCFMPTGASLTFGEMPPAQKHRLSHRADAFTQLIRACLT